MSRYEEKIRWPDDTGTAVRTNRNTHGALVKGKQLLILVDWSNADKELRHFILRASLAVEGRAMTLLQMVTTQSDYNCPHVRKAFLTRLKAMLPAGDSHRFRLQSAMV